MAQPFPHTLRSLQNDSGRAAFIGLCLLLGAAVVWSIWLFKARISVYEVSKKTRLEIRGATYPILAPVAGKLAAVEVTLGQSVKQGALLFKLDTAVEQLRLLTARARLEALDPQLEVTRSELRATEGAVLAERSTGGIAAKQAKVRSQEASISASLAESEATRYGRLGSAVSQLELERIRTTAQMRQVSSQASELDVRRLQGEQRTRLKSGEARVAGLRRELTILQGEKQTLLGTIAELEQEIEHHSIRAPGDGYIGELQPLHAGLYVALGAQLATLLPVGDLILVAEFEPASALGRIRPQQSAELRLTGFPWLEFGTVPARVTRVASELHDGTIRVELELLKDTRSLIPFQHGLPGSVEVTVESVSPAELLLRSLGRRLDGATHSP